MPRRDQGEDTMAVTVLLLSVLGGVIAVVATLAAFRLLGGAQGTPAAAQVRIGSYVLWTQPFIYVMSGLLAGMRDARWGPMRAPVIGLFLASLCWFLLRRQDLLPSQPDILAYLLPAGALFTLFGALVAPLLRERVGAVIGLIVALGVAAFVYAYLSLGAVSGQVTREVIQRAAGMTTAMTTTPVASARVALLGGPEGPVLYSTQTNASGRFLISGVPMRQYTLRVWDPATPAVISDEVQVERAITGGTRWKTISLPTQTVDSGELFR